MMADLGREFLDVWHRIVAQRDVAALADVLSDDVSIGAPPYWNRIEGHAPVHHLLGLILQTIDDFTYHREWCDGPELALEFTGHVGELELQGIDLITLDPGGGAAQAAGTPKIRRLDVLIRPVESVIALREIIRPKMVAFLAGQSTES
jgi:hypothetical protein